MLKNLKKLCFTILIVLSISACNLPGLGADATGEDIVIIGGSMTERQILSEISLQMVHHYIPEVKTDLIDNVASDMIKIQALRNQEANVAGVMYTGTSLTAELGMEPITEPDRAFTEVITGYYERFDMVWMPSYGFANTYAFLVREDFSKEHNITKISDLEDMASDLRAGVDTGWKERRADGYNSFKEVYFDFDQVLPMQIGLVYDAVEAGQVDLVLGYSTDGRIQANDLVVIEDDRRLFPPYDASPIVSMDMLEKHPELEDIFLRLSDQIDTEKMQELNRTSDEDKIEPRVIAREFLEENNYFEDVKTIPLSEREDYIEISKEIAKRVDDKE